jgi:hypothetical protein
VALRLQEGEWKEGEEEVGVDEEKKQEEIDG